MALTGWSASNYLARLSQVVNTYPFVISAWVYRVSTTGTRQIANVTTSNQAQRRGGLVLTSGNLPNGQAYDGTTFGGASASLASTVSTWFHAGAELISTTSRAVLLNGANRGTNASTINPATSDRIRIGSLPDASETMGSSDGIAEISIWDGGGMSAANMDSLLLKLYNGGAAGAGGNPLNITAESSQPWTGKLVWYRRFLVLLRLTMATVRKI